MNLNTALKAICFLCVAAPFSRAQGCIEPTEVSDAMKATISGLLSGGLPYAFLPLAPDLAAAISKDYETPIQFRLAAAHGNAVYNVAAMYHPTALDIWGRDDYRICVEEGDMDAAIHQEIAIAYAFAYSASIRVPSSADAMQGIMEGFLNLPLSNLPADGEEDPATPWGLAKLAVDEMTAFISSDGWNADGLLANSYNKMPYSDFSIEGNDGETYGGYEVDYINGVPKGNGNKRRWPWQPLLESDGRGYFTKQEHVTPFIGFTGRLLGIDKASFENFTVSGRTYDYDQEAAYVLEQTRKMATNDTQKMLIEYFDSKFTSLLPLQIGWSLMKGLDLFDFWFYELAFVNAMYDATMLVWKEKVEQNAVRPTTVVHGLVDEQEVITYAGPFQGAKEVKGNDWQPYIRTMPHAEYPSGSACVCTAFAETLQLLSEDSDTISPPLQKVFPAGSSLMEPGTTPASDIAVTFNTWSEIETLCGESRLHGGMHFDQSVPAGHDLCSGLVNSVVDRALLLAEGNPEGAMADKDDASIRVSPGSSRRRLLVRKIGS